MTEDKLTTPNPTDLALPFNYGEDAGVGMDVTLDDLRIPFAVLAQTESKILIEGEPKFVPGGVPGDILNSATKSYSKGDVGLLLVPSSLKTTVVEFLPDNQGFVAEHKIDSDIAKSASDNGYKRNGNDLVKTKTMVATIVDEDLYPTGFIVIPFSSSKLAAWSSYFTVIDSAKVTHSAPIFANLIRIVSFDDRNREGKRYKNYLMFPARNENGEIIVTEGLSSPDRVTASRTGYGIGSLLDPSSPAVLAAKQLREQLASGVATIDRAGSADAGEKGSQHF